MAKGSPDTFSFAEFAVAGVMTKRAFQHIVEANAKSPRADWLPPGGGIRCLKRVSVIGGFMAAGAPLFPAARVASAVLSEFNTYDGEAPSLISHLATKLPSEAWRRLPDCDPDCDYWFHSELIKYPSLYTPGNALQGDAIVEIVDRRHVYMLSPHGPIRNTWDGADESASYIGRIEGWERDSSAFFVSVSEMAPFNHDDPEFASKGAKVNALSRAAYRNAVGRSAVNVSLAIRNGLDRVARHRGVLADEGEPDV